MATLNPATNVPRQVAAARLQVEAEGDQLDAQLTGPVDCTATDTTVAVQDATDWRDFALDGAAPTLDCARSVASQRAERDCGRCARRAAIGRGYERETLGDELARGRRGLEHHRAARGDGRRLDTGTALPANWRRSRRNWCVARCRWRRRTCGSRPAARARRERTAWLHFAPTSRASLSWRSVAGQPLPYQPQGQVTGNIRFDQQADRITSELTATGEQVALQQFAGATNVRQAGYQTIWQEPQVNVRGTTTYEPGRRSARVSAVSSAVVDARGDGRRAGRPAVDDGRRERQRCAELRPGADHAAVEAVGGRRDSAGRQGNGAVSSGRESDADATGRALVADARSPRRVAVAECERVRTADRAGQSSGRARRRAGPRRSAGDRRGRRTAHDRAAGATRSGADGADACRPDRCSPTSASRRR